ncbi:hypothetical protein NJH83_17410 [Pseudomonas chlororaphis]|uniref:hypothetical protein n=1 Tax=Pseudomonas chlororaphis TaxID=587753 RepID=UPI00209A9034|nr:hypothetical protein [Pseudomonas chlororaphis]MCO7612017.1 hypothetical protein [Pseudomonas chlororaphis]
MPSTDSDSLRCRWLFLVVVALLGSWEGVVASEVQSPTTVADQAPEPSGVSARLPLSAGGLRAGAYCSYMACGKLIELQAFSGKMLDAALQDANRDGIVADQEALSQGLGVVDPVPGRAGVSSHQPRKTVSDPGGASSSLEDRSSGGSRRILWRQIQ